jgi:Zn-dependent peptidase ImmA (M78 family)
MGVRGSRPNPSRPVVSEPELIVDVVGVIASARQKGYIANCNTKIEEIVKDHNIDIVMEDMNSAQSGSLSYNNGKWVMRINQKHHPKRRRFTMAHEFAHYYLHREATPYFEDTTFFRNDNTSSIEFAANDFASKLLMPEEDVKKCISEGTSNLSDLANKFEVSIDAMRNRITNLGYKLQNNE